MPKLHKAEHIGTELVLNAYLGPRLFSRTKIFLNWTACISRGFFTMSNIERYRVIYLFSCYKHKAPLRTSNFDHQSLIHFDLNYTIVNDLKYVVYLVC